MNICRESVKFVAHEVGQPRVQCSEKELGTDQQNNRHLIVKIYNFTTKQLLLVDLHIVQSRCVCLPTADLGATTLIVSTRRCPNRLKIDQKIRSYCQYFHLSKLSCAINVADQVGGSDM